MVVPWQPGGLVGVFWGGRLVFFGMDFGGGEEVRLESGYFGCFEKEVFIEWILYD